MKYQGKAIQIIEAAYRLFAEKGFSGVSTRSIAKEAGVNEVTLFRHFETKERLFEAVMETYIFRPGFTMLEQLPSDNLEEFLKMLTYFMHRIFKENLMTLKLELLNHDKVMKDKSINRFPKEVKAILAKNFMKHKQLTENEAIVEASCFMASMQGLLINVYLFENLMLELDFEACLTTLVNKFK